MPVASGIWKSALMYVLVLNLLLILQCLLEIFIPAHFVIIIIFILCFISYYTVQMFLHSIAAKIVLFPSLLFGSQNEAIYQNNTYFIYLSAIRFVDNIELLEDNYRFNKNLDLTYAVRDGIISHCGEVDQNGLRPRDELIDLKLFTQAGQYQPATWEGCVVKLSDKIAYVGRDIEDAINLGFLDASAQEKLLKMARLYDQKVMNTTVIMHNMIIDICNSSSPENGIALSQTFLEQINEIKKFNYTHIYGNKRLKPYMHYSELVITEIFTVLLDCYDEKHTFSALDTQLQYSPILLGSFKKWLCRYCESDFIPNNYIDRS